MDVGGWLRGLGLGQYEEKFRDNKIDADLLPRLTVDDLKDIGVSVVGDRRRLLDAIAVMAGAGRPADLPASPTKSAPSKGLQASAERRPITVMFCDLVGSTSLAAKLDAEDWRNLVNAYLDEASAAVTGLGGHVLKKLGDGLMALFGYPHAQENDAERAVRAALAIQRALADLNARNARSGAPELSARIGIECGSVVVDAGGEVFGEAPNVAARVQAAAEPGSVLITGSVQRQVAGLFVVEEKGAHELKGVAQPLSLYRVVRASGGGRRGGARALTSFVGREEDIGTLLRRWDRVRAGEGQFVLIVGEPGLGKSRLIEEFHTRLGETPHTWTECSSSQLLQNTPLHPLAEWGRLRFGEDLPAEQRLADLENTLRLVGLDVGEYAPLIAPLVDIPLPKERAAKFAPEELRRRQLAAVTAWFLAGARTQPVVVAFEDLHWADPTSLDLIQSLAERGAQAPLLVVATTRPEFRAPWGMRSHHAVVALAPLDRTEVRRMVGDIAAQHALPQEVVERVSERTGGVPLFVEEVTRLLVERGEQGGVQAIPPTLQQSLAARLDRLGPAREVAQVGAVLGRDFVYALLRDVAGLDESALQPALERLTEADLLFVEGAPPEAKYRFKHALIQDAAYDSLLKSRRQALHRRAAEALLAAQAEPEAIAYHFTEAGLDDAAIEWWGKAGDQALRRSAFQEAISHLGKAIEMADKPRGGSAESAVAGLASAGQRLKLQTSYGRAMTLLRGFASVESKAAFTRARELAAGIDNAAERFAAYYGQWIGSIIRGETRMARDMAEVFLDEAEDEGRLMEIAAARRCVGLSCFAMGDFADARRYFDQALTDCDAEGDADVRFRFLHDTEAAAKMTLALVIWHLGEIGRAQQLMDEALRRTVELGHAPTTASVNVYRGLLETARGDAQATLNAAEVLVRLGKEHGMALYLAVGELFSSWARGWLIDPKIGAIEYRNALKNYLDQGNKYTAPFNKGLLAELDAGAGDLQSALTSIDEGLALAQETQQHWSDVFLYRLRGEILLKQDARNSTPAAEAFQTALAIAHLQGARSYGLRAALSLAKLYRSTGRLAEAHAVLAPALEGFSPTLEMPEIAEAQALLAALEETDEVKSAAAARQRRLELQTRYGQAVMWSKGFQAEETKEAFARARELVRGAGSTAGPFATYYGTWVGQIQRAEIGLARQTAETFRCEAEPGTWPTEASVALRILGLTSLCQGDIAEASARLEQALNLSDPERDPEAKFHFGVVPAAGAMIHLALARVLVGEVQQARVLSEEAAARAAESDHAPTKALIYHFKALIEICRDDAEAALHAARVVLDVSREHGLALYLVFGELPYAWALARLGDRMDGAEQLRQALAAYVDRGNRWYVPFFQALLAEVEAERQDDDGALSRIEGALALANATGERWTDAMLHRIRGEILLKRDPANPSPAEEAFLTAIAVAQRQGTRAFGLRAALSLAKLYQATARPAEAHAVLSSALEGFAPTSEMPEIAEAQALLVAIEAGAHVRHE